MMMPKATDEDKTRFRSLVTEAPGVEVKPMFGQLGAFVNGNMFAGLFAPQVGVKLTAEDAAALEALGGGPFGPEEHPMGGYLTLPADLSDDEARDWVERAREHVATFPPKAKRK